MSKRLVTANPTHTWWQCHGTFNISSSPYVQGQENGCDAVYDNVILSGCLCFFSALMKEFEAQDLLGVIGSGLNGVQVVEPSSCFHVSPYTDHLRNNLGKHFEPPSPSLIEQLSVIDCGYMVGPDRIGLSHKPMLPLDGGAVTCLSIHASDQM